MTSAARFALMIGCASIGANGCTVDTRSPLGNGTIHQADIEYCDPEWGCYIPRDFDTVAVGATFGLRYDGAFLVSLAPSRVEELDTTDAGLAAAHMGESLATWFRAAGAGVTAVQARSEGGLDDFVLVTTVSPGSLRIRTCTRAFNRIAAPDDAIPLFECVANDADAAGLVISRGASLAPTVCGVVDDKAGNELAGLLPLQWSAQDNASAELELHVAHDARCATIGGLAPGTNTVTVRMGALADAISVVVVP